MKRVILAEARRIATVAHPSRIWIEHRDVSPSPAESVPRPSDSLRKRAGLMVNFSSTPDSESRPVW